ncbi:hypothetical protein PoB_004979700 [Plakobranchus ocellatus]|uniref:Uncharacterized protein n=1 Tax=Plakobranchus ocellatus TaxID=259542 RepID=A0AAV4BVC6_9GAST|nr:hypothetical protein PoB_004979700 [Plakobranchus ocellatus]
MGSITLVSVTAILFVPETHKKALVETMSETEPSPTKGESGNIHKLSLDIVIVAADGPSIGESENYELSEVDSKTSMVA